MSLFQKNLAIGKRIVTNWDRNNCKFPRTNSQIHSNDVTLRTHRDYSPFCHLIDGGWISCSIDTEATLSVLQLNSPFLVVMHMLKQWGVLNKPQRVPVSQPVSFCLGPLHTNTHFSWLAPIHFLGWDFLVKYNTVIFFLPKGGNSSWVWIQHSGKFNHFAFICVLQSKEVQILESSPLLNLVPRPHPHPQFLGKILNRHRQNS